MPIKKQASAKSGLQFPRRFTREDVNVFDLFEYDYRTSVIRNPSGEVVFEMTNVEVPKQWSQIATDILAQKYFRKMEVLAVKLQQSKLHTVWQIAGECGVNVMVTLLQKKMHRFFMKSWSILY
jgi:ribonucleoside-diphosphate reductase alpha chain